MLLVAVVWGVVLLVLAFVTTGKPTVREQQSPADALPAVDKAVRAVLSASRGLAVPVLGQYRQVRRCSISVARDGVDYQRSVRLYGAGGRLLHRIADRLPPGYKSTEAPVVDDARPVVVAHPGPFLKLTIRTVDGDPGELDAIVDTGCRPTTDSPYTEFRPAASAAERAPVTGPFELLAVAPETWTRASLPCGAVTVTATGHADEALPPLPGLITSEALPGTPLTRDDDRLTYQGSPDVVVRAAGDRVTVSATTTCH